MDALLRTAFFTLTCTRPGKWSCGTGRLLQAAFLDSVRQHDADLAARLHGDGPAREQALGGLRLYSVAAPWGMRGAQTATAAREGDELVVRISSVDEPLSAAFDAILDKMRSRTARLGPCEFTVSAVDAGTDGRTLAVAGRASDIATYWMRDAPPEVAEDSMARVTFLTPTTFRHDGELVALPLPSLVFARLRRLWNMVAPTPVDDLTAAAICDECMIAGDTCEVVHVVCGRRMRLRAFVGTCDFAWPRSTAPVRRAAQMLLDFSFFAGIGYKTTMGFGAIAPVERIASHMG